MAVNLYWLEPDPIFVTEYVGQMTGEDMETAFTAVKAACDERPVGVIGDMTHVTSFDPQQTNMPRAVQMLRHPNMRGLVAITTRHRIIGLIAPMLGAGFGVRMCETREEAVAYLKSKLTGDRVR
jgi:hypothetical protein